MRQPSEINPHETREEQSFGGGDPYSAKVCFEERTYDWFAEHRWDAATGICSRCGKRQPTNMLQP